MANALLRTERLDARLTREEKQTIETAASLRGTSASDFVRVAVKEAALKTIREHESLALSERAREIFVNALLNPPAANDEAMRAVKRLREETA